jgi:hypothetical protein
MLHMPHSTFLLTFRLPLAENCVVINIIVEHKYNRCICRGSSIPRPPKSIDLTRNGSDESLLSSGTALHSAFDTVRALSDKVLSDV